MEERVYLEWEWVIPYRFHIGGKVGTSVKRRICPRRFYRIFTFDRFLLIVGLGVSWLFDIIVESSSLSMTRMFL